MISLSFQEQNPKIVLFIPITKTPIIEYVDRYLDYFRRCICCAATESVTEDTLLGAKLSTRSSKAKVTDDYNVCSSNEYVLTLQVSVSNLLFVEVEES